MVQDPRDLAEQRADPLGALGDLDVEQLLDGEREALLVGHHGDVVEAVEVGQGLQVRLVLDQLLGAAVQQPHMRVRPHDLLAIELEDQPQHAVRGRVLRAEVDRVVPDLALRWVLALVGRQIDMLGVVLVGRMREGRVGRDQARGSRFDGFGVVPRERGGEGPGGVAGEGGREGRGAATEALGGVAAETK